MITDSTCTQIAPHRSNSTATAGTPLPALANAAPAAHTSSSGTSKNRRHHGIHGNAYHLSFRRNGVYLHFYQLRHTNPRTSGEEAPYATVNKIEQKKNSTTRKP
jgi:GTP cyclohydrolase III